MSASTCVDVCTLIIIAVDNDYWLPALLESTNIVHYSHCKAISCGQVSKAALVSSYMHTLGHYYFVEFMIVFFIRKFPEWYSYAGGQVITITHIIH